MGMTQIKFASTPETEGGEYKLELWINGQFNSSWKPPLNFIDHKDLQKFAMMVNKGIEAGKDGARREMRSALGIHS